MVAALLLLAAVPTYDEAAALAAKEGNPLVIFVGCPVLKVDRAVTLGLSRWEHLKGTGIVVAYPDWKGWMKWVEVSPGEWSLPATAGPDDIRRVLDREDARRRAFVRSFEATFRTGAVPVMRGGSC